MNATKIMQKMRFNQLGRKPDSSSSCRFGANATRVEMLVTLSNPCTWDSIGSVLRRRRKCATYVASTPGGNVNEKIAEIQIASGSSCFCPIGINTKNVVRRSWMRNLQRQRSDELEILCRMTSCPLRKNSFGKYEIFKTQVGGVDDRYDWSIGVLKDRIDKLERRKKTERTAEGMTQSAL